jgi:hypothetical protein
MAFCNWKCISISLAVLPFPVIHQNWYCTVAVILYIY